MTAPPLVPVREAQIKEKGIVLTSAKPLASPAVTLSLLLLPDHLLPRPLLSSLGPSGAQELWVHCPWNPAPPEPPERAGRCRVPGLQPGLSTSRPPPGWVCSRGEESGESGRATRSVHTLSEARRFILEFQPILPSRWGRQPTAIQEPHCNTRDSRGPGSRRVEPKPHSSHGGAQPSLGTHWPGRAGSPLRPRSLVRAGR